MTKLSTSAAQALSSALAGDGRDGEALGETEELAIFKLVEGPAPDNVLYSAVPIMRREVRNKEKEVVGEVVELQHIRFVGATIEEVRAKAADQFRADRERALQRERYLRERRSKKVVSHD